MIVKYKNEVVLPGMWPHGTVIPSIIAENMAFVGHDFCLSGLPETHKNTCVYLCVEGASTHSNKVLVILAPKSGTSEVLFILSKNSRRMATGEVVIVGDG